uniref:Uncharacterized protein n=1 Tax=Aegilops tauschii TaxID=37682 RepID=N1QZP5_AEGTA
MLRATTDFFITDSDDYFPDDDFFPDVDNLIDGMAGEDVDPKSPVTVLGSSFCPIDAAVAEFLNGSSYRYETPEENLVDVVLAHPAALRVEEIRLVAKEWRSDAYYDGEIIWDRICAYKLTLDKLPWETLRVLDLTNCQGLYQAKKAAAVVLPRLPSLRLRHCGQHLVSLQSVIDAAPVLAAVRLESVLIDATNHDNCWGCGNKIDRWASSDEDDDDDDDDAPQSPPKEAAPCRLRCPAATLLVLERCKWEEKEYGRHGHSYRDDDDDKLVNLIAAEIEAPSLRRFRYKGYLRPFSFSSQPPELEQVDLEFFPYHDDDNHKNKEPNRILATIWRLVRSFTSTREMKLRLNHLEDIAVLREARRVELLPAFRRLERLELQGVHRPKGKTASVTIANLLRRCPLLRDLWSNLTAKDQEARKNYQHAHEFFERKFRYDRDKSMDCLDHCRRDSEPDTVSKEGEGDGANNDEVSEIPGLSRSFECLQSSLRRVCLQFQLEKSNCLGLQLIKFFAENAMVLEEMHIDVGNRKLWEHMNSKVEAWIANSCKRKPGAPSFVVLPLKRWLYKE